MSKIDLHKFITTITSLIYIYIYRNFDNCLVFNKKI